VRRSSARQSPTAQDGRSKVLIISASMGAGHDGAARSLADQLRRDGADAEVRDFLGSGPLRIGSALRSGYEFELKHIPGAYDATYRLWYRVPWLCPAVAWLVTVLTRRRVLRWVQASGAAVVVSTYPLATLCLGRLRASGRLKVPAVNFITDFGVHPLWVHRGIDLNLAVHDSAAQMANARTGRPSVACGPVVSPSFAPGNLPDRASARASFGLAERDRAVLVVAGSWGVGDVEATWDAITADGRYTPVVVCGRDDQLLRQVRALAEGTSGGAVVLGWTDQMPALMAACDALVENAGGLTSLEAMRAGLPVVSFQPIAGHGRENTWRMHSAGVSTFAATDADLANALGVLTEPGPARDDQIGRGVSMFRSDPGELVMEVAANPPLPILAHRRAVGVAVRVAASLAAVVSLGWAGLTSGVAMATEAGAGVAHPLHNRADVAYIGVRLDAQELSNPTVSSYLESLHLTAVVDNLTATADAAALRSLATRGVNIENGGVGDPQRAHGHDRDSLPWSRARLDARAGLRLELLIGKPVTITVPGRRVNAWDLIECGNAHTSLVVPNHILDVAKLWEEGGVIHLSPRRIYLVNGLGATPAQMVAYLQELSSSLSAAHLSASPLATLA
jgi:processive 1,2-diacylglycerol beta-glucosyltransferase